MKPPPEVISGTTHNRLLGAAVDTAHGFRVVPGLMLSMLREDGWRRMVRPIDGREFVNETVHEWVLGEPWGGLHFPSWDALYAMLDRSDDGPECKQRLIELGAPANGAAADARARPVGRPSKSSVGRIAEPTGGNSVERLAGRLKRDNPALAADVIAGRLSAHAAAVQAGVDPPGQWGRRDPIRRTPKVARSSRLPLLGAPVRVRSSADCLEPGGSLERCRAAAAGGRLCRRCVSSRPCP